MSASSATKEIRIVVGDGDDLEREALERLLGQHGYRVDFVADAASARSPRAGLDRLTGLPDRVVFVDRLRKALFQAEQYGQQPAVLIIGLDRFRRINETLGNGVGDSLLRAVTQRLQDCLSAGDTLSRFGGDEFALLLPDVATEADAAQMAARLLDALARPLEVRDEPVRVSASIGVAVWPEAGTSLDALMTSADLAMLRAKEGGANRYCVFTSEMSLGVHQDLMLEREMRRGLDCGQFEVHYQPQVCMKSGAMLGVEALSRWNHPELGAIPPESFIPIAENSQLILVLDRMILRRACRDIRRLHRSGAAGLRLSVNLSPLWVARHDFVDAVLGILAAEEFPPQLLELEITETLLMDDGPELVQRLLSLQRAGIAIAIDDFGTGYSSLSYLQKFPVSTLKIDRRFIHGITDDKGAACIVDAIIAMAQGLHLRVVAEGVEHDSQRRYLSRLECPVAQGFLFSKALPVEQLALQWQTPTTSLQ